MAVLEESDLSSPKKGQKTKVISFSLCFVDLSDLDIRLICAIELRMRERKQN